ncbi:hypothetical protein E2562_022040 [Oryza meyeriana var. granulata]|uniref:Uncharacterized protein n=1 Tax=Oryza meyeriana var. granulata TaxID=110450 RepID=A0A6G1ENJ7_9ORYZ|nr:hypothetical protein E2562_022040 [Oryza meyeriana var. granulata]
MPAACLAFPKSTSLESVEAAPILGHAWRRSRVCWRRRREARLLRLLHGGAAGGPHRKESALRLDPDPAEVTQILPSLEMASSTRLPYSTAGGGGGRRGGSGSGVMAPLVVLFLFVLAPSIFFVARNGGPPVHVASG